MELLQLIIKIGFPINFWLQSIVSPAFIYIESDNVYV